MLIEKRNFVLPHFETVSGALLKDVQVGFETYGTLSAQRDNVILVPHFFSGNSHAAGKYAQDDRQPGYWDMLIGPGKAIDTNRYFVVSVDSLCNINLDERTVTTGPSSIDPDTGKPYGLSFPMLTLHDSVKVQHALMASLGITELHAVAGVSMGSMQALIWAANYPQQVQRVIGLTPNGVAASDYGIQMLSHMMQAIRLDPKWRGGDYYGKEPPLDGIALMLSTMLHWARHWDWAAPAFARRAALDHADPADHLDNLFSIEKTFETTSRMRAAAIDANNFLYLAKANQTFSLLPGARDGDYRHITAKTLLITVSTDLLLHRENAVRFGQMLEENGTPVQMREIATPGGHLAGVVEAGAAAEWINAFIER